MQKEKEKKGRDIEIMEESIGKEETLPPGFRFHPTDEELINCYLINKISDSSFTGRAITDIDLNKSEPWELPGKAKMGEKEWYFFSKRDRKYPTGVRTNRATNTGYWKTTGKDREIFNSVTSELVGLKKTLVFYKGRAPRGEKSNWVMHEYRIHSKSTFRTNKDEWVVCRVFKKSGGAKKYPSHSNHTRTVLNPYSMQETCQNNMMAMPPPMMMQYLQGLQGEYTSAPHNFLYERNNNYINNTTAEVLRGGTNLPIMQYSHLNYPAFSAVDEGGGFSISGLNLNLGSGGGGGGTTTTTQPINIMRPIQHSHAIADHVSSINMNMSGADQNVNNNIVGNYGTMDHCMDLDTYWPNSY